MGKLNSEHRDANEQAQLYRDDVQQNKFLLMTSQKDNPSPISELQLEFQRLHGTEGPKYLALAEQGGQIKDTYIARSRGGGTSSFTHGGMAQSKSRIYGTEAPQISGITLTSKKLGYGPIPVLYLLHS
eukprot:scaffold5226_cov90-Skeletonema_menzelii.AAC.1